MGSMRFALSLATCPQWSNPDALAQARSAGFEGVEALPAAGAAGELPVAVVRSEGGVFDDPGKLKATIEAAGRVSAGVVSVRGMEIARGIDRGSAVRKMIERLAPLADQAAACGVTLAVENGGMFPRARDLWAVFDALGHPAVGCSFDYVISTAEGEHVSVSVPTLGSRIRHVIVRGSRIESDAKSLRVLLTRLRGIGYAGWVSVRCDAGTSLDAIAAAVGRLKELAEIESPKPAPAKAAAPAARAAAKPAAAAVAAAGKSAPQTQHPPEKSGG
jgi:sugar phosphate isomerase/epimerase